jgi:hypothetical protein
LENFDLNLAFFAQIPQQDFDDALPEMLGKNKRLRPITNLRSLDGDEGVYVLVLDDYRQAYIGQATDMRRRIKAHWTGTKTVRPAAVGLRRGISAVDRLVPGAGYHPHLCRPDHQCGRPGDQAREQLPAGLPAQPHRRRRGDRPPELSVAAEMKRQRLTTGSDTSQ